MSITFCKKLVTLKTLRGCCHTTPCSKFQVINYNLKSFFRTSWRVFDNYTGLGFGVEMVEIESNFPYSALLPKKETGVTSFLNKYPEYDGRGITIAIFDSGVDPGSAGLQVTSEGKPKIIERYDCSGAGDVDTSTVVQAVNGEITGVTGRTLKIPTTWVNPSGNFHIGIKNAFELYPKKLQDRIKKQRKEKLWDPMHKTALSSSTRQLNAINKSLDANKSSPPRADKLNKEEAEVQVEILTNIDKKMNDVGPVYDCVLFHDGNIWRACLDTSEKGDLASCNLLGEYSKTREFTSLTPTDSLNYSINVHDEGNTLEVVSLASSHGTHVAAIAAACFPDNPELNGVAPGAQIVSLCIADSRIETEETGTSLVRAMIRMMKTMDTDKIPIINMSYGEQTHFCSTGRIGELMNEVVDKYGVIWVCAAGNQGPGLSTVNTPPDISTTNIIGVGAYVSPEMMQAEYSLRQKLPGMPYTWTSRGPTTDGDKGVSICAPGAAITSVPCFTLHGTQLLNGTSMASPHVTGAVAILLSGLKSKGLKYSPYSVKRALENSALFVDSMDIFAQGNGLLQVERAFEHLVNFAEEPESNVRFHVTCGVGNNKGILIRGGLQEIAREYAVTIEPVFADSDNVEAEKKIGFNLSLALACNASWVQYPSHLELMNLARLISIRVDQTGLPPGVHSTNIRAYDVTKPEKGPVFRIEITVIRPHIISKDLLRPIFNVTNEEFQPNTIKRHFIQVPDEVTWATVRLQGQQADKYGRFVVHCIQLRPKRASKTLEFHKMVNINAQSETVLSFQVKGGLVLEVVVAKYWANLGDMSLNYSIEFHGCRPECSSVVMHHADGLYSIDLHSGLQVEEISPSIQLKNIVAVLRPTEAKVLALTSRDTIPPSRPIYQLQLTYTFHLNKALEVIPNNALLSNLLYENEFESQLWMLFDSNKQFLGSGDAFANRYSVKLEKGDYTILQQVRHDKRDLLEKLVDMPLQLSQKLPTPISVDVYGSQSQALVGGKKMTFAVIPCGKFILPLYVAPLPTEKLHKLGITGNFFTGTMTFSKDEHGKKVDVYPFKYILMEGNKKNSGNNKTTNDKTKWEEYEDAVRDTKVSWLYKLEPGSEADTLYEELCSAYKDHLAVHTAMQNNLEPDSQREWPGAEKRVPEITLKRISSIAKIVLNAVDKVELLAYIGTKSDQRDDASKIKIAMDRQKVALIDALSRHGCAIARLYLLQQEKKGDGDVIQESSSLITLSDIDAIYLDLIRFVDSNDTKKVYYTVHHSKAMDGFIRTTRVDRQRLYFVQHSNLSESVGQTQVSHFIAWHAAVHEHFGRLLKILIKQNEEKSSKEVEESMVWAMERLGWKHWAQYLSSTTAVRYPPAYRQF